MQGKVAQAFHLPDLKDIIVDEPKEVEGGVDAVAWDKPTEAGEAAEAEADLNPPRSPNLLKLPHRRANQAQCERPLRM